MTRAPPPPRRGGWRRLGGAAVIAAAVAALAACRSGPAFQAGSAIAAPASARPAAPAKPPDPLLAFVAQAAPGQARTFGDPARGPLRVVMDRQYFSADGVVCRRFTVAPATGAAERHVETRVACRKGEGWQLGAIVSKGAPTDR